MKYQLSDQGAEFLSIREEFRAFPYLDSAGVPTIGYGNTYYEDGKQVSISDPPVSYARALQLYKHIHKEFEIELNKLVKDVDLKPHQFDMLLSLIYNIGGSNFSSSTLLKLIKQNPNHPYITREFGKWVKAGGKVSLGLARRRSMEAFIYVFGYDQIRTFNW